MRSRHALLLSAPDTTLPWPATRGKSSPCAPDIPMALPSIPAASAPAHPNNAEALPLADSINGSTQTLMVAEAGAGATAPAPGTAPWGAGETDSEVSAGGVNLVSALYATAVLRSIRVIQRLRSSWPATGIAASWVSSAWHGAPGCCKMGLLSNNARAAAACHGNVRNKCLNRHSALAIRACVEGCADAGRACECTNARGPPGVSSMWYNAGGAEAVDDRAVKIDSMMPRLLSTQLTPTTLLQPTLRSSLLSPKLVLQDKALLAACDAATDISTALSRHAAASLSRSPLLPLLPTLLPPTEPNRGCFSGPVSVSCVCAQERTAPPMALPRLPRPLLLLLSAPPRNRTSLSA